MSNEDFIKAAMECGLVIDKQEIKFVKDGALLGTLKIDNPVSFSGNVDDCAHMFFSTVLQMATQHNQENDYYEEENEEFDQEPWARVVH